MLASVQRNAKRLIRLLLLSTMVAAAIECRVCCASLLTRNEMTLAAVSGVGSAAGSRQSEAQRRRQPQHPVDESDDPCRIEMPIQSPATSGDAQNMGTAPGGQATAICHLVEMTPNDLSQWFVVDISLFFPAAPQFELLRPPQG